MKKNNRKGFTLAELLIVVAIIAVLIAIAVPIFVSALGKAQQAVVDANTRSMKAMATIEILNDDTLLYKDDGTVEDGWWAIGVCDGTGKITLVQVVRNSDTTTTKLWSESSKTKGSLTSPAVDYEYQLYTDITPSDVELTEKPAKKS